MALNVTDAVNLPSGLAGVRWKTEKATAIHKSLTNPQKEKSAMVKVTLECPAIRGKITIVADQSKSGTFIATGRSYEPYELEATTAGHALDEMLQALPSLRYSNETMLKRKARSDAMKAAIASGDRKAPGRPKANKPRAKPAVHSSEANGNAPTV